MVLLLGELGWVVHGREAGVDLRVVDACETGDVGVVVVLEEVVPGRGDHVAALRGDPVVGDAGDVGGLPGEVLFGVVLDEGEGVGFGDGGAEGYEVGDGAVPEW